MLFFKTIDSTTLELLRNIQNKKIFSELKLVGGTSLALQIGHRISDDLDFFGTFKADKIELENELKSLGNITLLNETQNVHTYSVNNIKVDLVNYPYPWLEKALTVDKINLAHKKDIAAMKLAAITGRGSKKDFIDLYFLMQTYSIDQMLHFYKQKYKDGNTFLVLKSLTYFDDADLDMNPKMFENFVWDDIKAHINQQVRQFIN